MRKQSLLACTLIIWMTACTPTKKATSDTSIIDIAGNLEQLTVLKTSDFGKNIRYVALETTDESLVDGNPIIKVLKNHIITTTRNQCYVFDKATGKFITQVGRVSEDPEGYSSAQCWADETEDILYFQRRPGQLIKYDLNGNFVGKMELKSSNSIPSYMIFTDSSIIGYYNDVFKNINTVLAFFDKEGNLRDSISGLLTPYTESIGELNDISVLKNLNSYGLMGEAALMVLNYKNGNSQISVAGAISLWENKGEIRFKESFIDTLYTVKDNKLKPFLTFDTGSWFWPENDRGNKEDSNKRILVSYAAESDQLVFFQCIKGLFDNTVLYNGLYDKKTGETKLSKNAETIPDDLTNFMPFQLRSVSNRGEFTGLLEAPNIIEWLEEHPETKKEGKLAFLKDITEDANPVVVIVE